MYVASVDVMESWYQGETIRTNEIHIVEANGSEQAVDKLERHYLLKDIEHCVTYGIDVISINELIK